MSLRKNAARALSIGVAGVSLAMSISLSAFATPTTTYNTDDRDPQNGNGAECPVGSELQQHATQAAFDAAVHESRQDGTFVQEPSSRSAALGFCKLTNTNQQQQQLHNNNRGGDQNNALTVGPNALSPQAASVAEAKAEQLLQNSNNASVGDIANQLRAALQSENNISLTPQQATNVVTTVQNRLAQTQNARTGDNGVQIISDDDTVVEAPIIPIEVAPANPVSGTSGRRFNLGVACPGFSVNVDDHVYAANEATDVRLSVLNIFGGGVNRSENGSMPAAPVSTATVEGTVDGILTGTIRQNNCPTPAAVTTAPEPTPAVQVTTPAPNVVERTPENGKE
jgi:hypothetical protein